MEYAGHMLTMDDGNKIGFDLPIRDAVEVDGIIVVVLEVHSPHSALDNAYGVRDGRIIWQVEQQPVVPPPRRFQIPNPIELLRRLLFGLFTLIYNLIWPRDHEETEYTPFNCYVGVNPGDPGEVVLFGYSGFAYYVDINTGKIGRSIFTK